MADLNIPPGSAAPFPAAIAAREAMAAGLPMAAGDQHAGGVIAGGQPFGRVLEESLLAERPAPRSEGSDPVDEKNEALLSVLGPAGAMLPPQLVGRLLATSSAPSPTTSDAADSGASATALLDAFIARRIATSEPSAAATPSAPSAPAADPNPSQAPATSHPQHAPTPSHTPSAPSAPQPTGAPRVLSEPNAPDAPDASITSTIANSERHRLTPSTAAPDTSNTARSGRFYQNLDPAPSSEGNTVVSAPGSAPLATEHASELIGITSQIRTSPEGAPTSPNVRAAQDSTLVQAGTPHQQSERGTTQNRPTAEIANADPGGLTGRLSQPFADLPDQGPVARPAVVDGQDRAETPIAVLPDTGDETPVVMRSDTGTMPPAAADRSPDASTRRSPLRDDAIAALPWAMRDSMLPESSVTTAAQPERNPQTAPAATPDTATRRPLVEPSVHASTQPIDDVIRFRIESSQLSPSVRLSGAGRGSSAASTGTIPEGAIDGSRPQDAAAGVPEGSTKPAALPDTAPSAATRMPDNIILSDGDVAYVEHGTAGLTTPSPEPLRAPGTTQPLGMTGPQLPDRDFVPEPDPTILTPAAPAPLTQTLDGAVSSAAAAQTFVAATSADTENTTDRLPDTATSHVPNGPIEPVLTAPLPPLAGLNATHDTQGSTAPDTTRTSQSRPAVVTAPTVAAPTGVTQAVDQVASALAMSIRNGRTEVNIALRPDTLGAVNVRVVAGDDGLVIHITAERNEAGDLLRSQIGELRQALVNHQVAVAEIHVLHNPPPVPTATAEQPSPWPEERAAPERDDERGRGRQSEEREQDDE